jgi:RES domain-containing protein
LIFWRISNHLTLDGRGGLRTSARWHSRGHRIVYASPNPATALLEVLVHAEIAFSDLPVSFRFLEIEAPDRISSETLDSAALPSGWQSQTATTQAVGDQWLASRRSALLLVPCVIVPETWNILLNPQHPAAAQVAIRRVHRHPFDQRLAKAGRGT